MYRMLILLALLCAAPLAAHNATLRGSAMLTGETTHAGTSVTIEFDPLWGHQDAAALAITEKTRGKYPKAVVSGETTTDARGAFVLKAEFTFQGEETPPTRKQWRNNQQVEVEYCSAKITLRHEGYRPYTVQATLNADGDDFSVSSMLAKVVTATGRVVDLATRNPVPNLELQFSCTVARQLANANATDRYGRPRYTTVYETQSWNVTTDDKGRFELKDETLPPQQYTLTPLDDKLAFSTASKASNGIYLRDGDNDIGDLMVVPGGRLKFKVVSDADGTPLGARCTLSGDRYRRVLASADGVVDATGIIVGDFALNVYLEGYWAVDLPVTIEEGKTTDLGEIRLDGFLDLDVIAISDTGGGIETYNVVATMIEGVKPPNYRQEFSVYGNLTAERTTLQRLRKGKWKVTVTAKGYATAEAEIELPTNEPLTIKLVEGGSIGVSVKIGDRGNYDNFSLFLVRCDSEYYKTLAALDDEGWRNLRIDANQPGVTGNQRSWGSPRLLEAMMPGKYLVIAFAGNFGVLREDNVEITRGKHTAVELRPEPPVVSVKVTKDGQPQAGIKLFFVTTSYNGGTVAEETSDDQGACRHEFNDAAMAYVLTQREMDWVGQPSQNNWEWGESLRRFKGDGIQLKFGTHTDVAVELNDPKGIWVTITLKAPDGVPLTAPQLTTKGSTGGWPRFESKQVGESWVFPRIPAGEYTVTTYAGGDRNQAVALTRDIKVDNPPEQSFEIEFEIQTFTVTVECPEGVDFSQVGIRLQKREDVGVFGMRTMTRDGRPDAQGKLAFVGLENDRYIIIGSAWDQNRQLVASGNVEVDSSEVSEATLKLSGDFGSLNLRVEGNPATGGRQDSATWQARFFDNMDEEVLPGDPAFAFGQVNYTRAVMGVPSGVYKVIVCAYGLQPATAYNVEIKRGVTTELTVTPSAAAVLKLTVEGIDARSLVQLGAKSNYLDANGQPVDILAPGKQLFNLMQSNQQNACEAWLLNLTPEVAKVVISIDGYEDIVINVVAEPGKTILHTAPVVKKAD